MYLFNLLFFALYRFEKANRYGYGMPYTQSCLYVALLMYMTLFGLVCSYSVYMYGVDSNILLSINRNAFVCLSLFIIFFVFSISYLFYLPYFKLHVENNKDYKLPKNQIRGCVLFWFIAVINLILLYYINTTQTEGVSKVQGDEPSEQNIERNETIDCEENYNNKVAYGKCQSILIESIEIIDGKTFEARRHNTYDYVKQGQWKIKSNSATKEKDSSIVYSISDSVKCKCKK